MTSIPHPVLGIAASERLAGLSILAAVVGIGFGLNGIQVADECQCVAGYGLGIVAALGGLISAAWRRKERSLRTLAAA